MKIRLLRAEILHADRHNNMSKLSHFFPQFCYRAYKSQSNVMNQNAQDVRFLTADLPNPSTPTAAMKSAALSYQYYRQRCALLQYRLEYNRDPRRQLYPFQLQRKL